MEVAEAKPKEVPRSFASLTAKEAFALVPAADVTPWLPDTLPRPPSDILIAVLERLQYFDLSGSEAGKILLIDALLAEIVQPFQNLKVWKAAPLYTASFPTGKAGFFTNLCQTARCAKPNFLPSAICRACWECCIFCARRAPGTSVDVR